MTEYSSNISYGSAVLHAIGGGRRNMPFVAWMIGWPLAEELERYLIFLRGISLGPDFEQASIVISLIIWIWISISLYEWRP